MSRVPPYSRKCPRSPPTFAYGALTRSGGPFQRPSANGAVSHCVGAAPHSLGPRTPAAFRCYATSVFATDDLGIHPTPSLTVRTTTTGSPPSPPDRATPQPTTNQSRARTRTIPPHAGPAHARLLLLLARTPRLSR